MSTEREEERQAPTRLLWIDKIPDPDLAKEAAERFAEQRVIRAGQEAWGRVTEVESFTAWAAIGRALAVGRRYALHLTGANAPMGQRYSKAFADWISRHHFAEMPKSTRSVAIELHENIEAITTWRATLTEKQRRRLVHPLSNVRRWRQATAPPPPDDAHGTDGVAKAHSAWRRFKAAVEGLPADQGAMVWKAVQAEVARCSTSAVTPSVTPTGVFGHQQFSITR